MPWMQANDIEQPHHWLGGERRRPCFGVGVRNLRVRWKDLILGHYSPAKRSEKACWKSPELDSRFLQELIPGRATDAYSNRTAKENRYYSISNPMNKITKYGVDKMATETIKKTSRGMRKHVRRMKQESRKMGVPVNELKKKVRAPQVSKTKKEA